MDEDVTVNQASSWKVKTVKTSTKAIAAVFDATANGENRFGVLAYNGNWRFDYANLMQKTKSIVSGAVYELELTENLQCLVNGEVVHVFESANFLSEKRFAIFNEKNAVMGFVGRVYYMKLSSVTGKRAYVPALDPTGTPCMFDLVTKKPFYNAATTGSGFIAGLTTKQAISLANLPATGGSLTVSLPLEAAFDANVQSALNTAADKGWTITVQYRESDLTTKNIEADFLESTGTQGITFNIPFSLEDKTTVEYMLTGTSPASGALYYRAFGGTRSNGNVSNGASGSDEVYFAWNSTCYLNPSSTQQSIWAANAAMQNRRIQLRAKNTAVLTNGKITLNGYSVTENKKEGDVSFTSGYQIFGWGGGTSFGSIMRLYSFKHERNGRMLVQLVPALDSTGKPCMFDTVTKNTVYNSGSGSDFIVGFDTTEKAAVSLSKLPVTTDGTLTVSLPAAAQDTDTLVPAAIDIATNRGWTIVTQYRED